MGDNYTIADPYLFTVSQWLEADGLDPKCIPRVIEHRARMAERPKRRQTCTSARLRQCRVSASRPFGGSAFSRP